MSIPRLIFGTAACLALCWYAAANPPEPDLSAILQHPAAFAGQRVEFYVETLVDSIDSDRFRIRQQDAALWVVGTAPPHAMHQFVSVAGNLNRDGTLQLDSVYVARYRRVKIAVSLLAIALAVMLAINFIRWNRTHFLIDQNA